MTLKEAFEQIRELPWQRNRKTGTEYGIIESYFFKTERVKATCWLKHLLGMSLSMDLEIHSNDVVIERSYKDEVPDTIIQQLQTILIKEVE
nr:MAG TPA: hypothetical protein [Caudoviricetes sp.]